MKIVEQVWSSKRHEYVDVDEALHSNCLKCNARLVRKKDKIACERGCGEVSIVKREIIEGEKWIIAALCKKIVISATRGEDGSVNILTERLPREIWNLIAKDMYYVDSEEDMEGLCDFGGENFRGWAVGSDEVEKILYAEAKKQATDIEREEARIFNEREQKENAERKCRQEEARKEKKRIDGLLAEIEVAFKDAEYPDPRVEQKENAAKYIEGFEKMRVDGERIDNPCNQENIYGGGEWFVIQKKWIWKIVNNGMDGDDWSKNNVETGGAGASGVRVKYNRKLAAKIRSLKTANKNMAENYATAMAKRIEKLTGEKVEME